MDIWWWYDRQRQVYGRVLFDPGQDHLQQHRPFPVRTMEESRSDVQHELRPVRLLRAQLAGRRLRASLSRMDGRRAPSRLARRRFLVVLAVGVTACGGSESDRVGGDVNPVTLPGSPDLELPGLDELPEAQRGAFEDGTITTAEYTEAFERFQACANVTVENVILNNRDPVSGYIEYGVNTVDGGGDPEDPNTPNGRCNAEEWFWTELAWQLSDPTFLQQGRQVEVDRYASEILPCLLENGVDAPATFDGVPTPESMALEDEWLRLYQAGKCGDSPAPQTAPRGSGPPGDEVPAATNQLTLADDGDATVEQLVGEAEVVVHGTVVSVESLGRPAAAEDPAAPEYIGVTIEVDSVLAGAADQPIRLAWDAYETNTNGTRVATWITNGLRPPEQGDEMLLFLGPVDPSFAEFVGGFPTYAPVRLDGVAYLNDGVITEVERNSPAGQDLLGRTITDVTSAIAA